MRQGSVQWDQYTARQKGRQAVRALRPLLDGGSGEFVIPAGVRLFVRRSTPTVAVTEALKVNGVGRFAPAAFPANVLHAVGYVERGNTVEASNGFDIYIDGGLGKYLKIGAPE